MTIPLNRSGAAFLGRAGIRKTYVGPGSRFAPELARVHGFPMAPPYPVPDLLIPQQGNPPPDRLSTEIWPHGQQ